MQMSAGAAISSSPGGDVDTVAKQVVVLDDDVAEVHPDAQLHPLALRQIGVAAMHRTLNGHGATNRLHGAIEL
ncbi:MAG: hypothetical protein ACREJ0_23520, partial [Geminicoccaceae bacterium]